MMKKPFRYELSPRTVEAGRDWLAVTLENAGTDTLTNLHVRVNSLDDYGIEVLSEGGFVPILDPDAKHVVPMQVLAKLSGSVYLTVDGDRGEESFHWESPDIMITVGQQAADLVSLLALVEPGVAVGETMRLEATLEGRVWSEGLDLEFWVETPDGAFEDVASIETKGLSPGEKARYVAQIEPKQQGRYTLYAYLYDGTDRIGRAVERIRIGTQ